jgi:hypothetical protein
VFHKKIWTAKHSLTRILCCIYIDGIHSFAILTWQISHRLWLTLTVILVSTWWESAQDVIMTLNKEYAETDLVTLQDSPTSRSKTTSFCTFLHCDAYIQQKLGFNELSRKGKKEQTQRLNGKRDTLCQAQEPERREGSQLWKGKPCSYHPSCNYCGWTSRGRLSESALPLSAPSLSFLPKTPLWTWGPPPGLSCAWAAAAA